MSADALVSRLQFTGYAVYHLSNDERDEMISVFPEAAAVIECGFNNDKFPSAEEFADYFTFAGDIVEKVTDLNDNILYDNQAEYVKYMKYLRDTGYFDY